MGLSPSATQEHGFTNRIVKIFLESNLSIILILLAAAIGLAALGLTPREEDPQIVVPLADVYVNFPGRSAAEVEQLVATPLEKILYQIDGVEYVYSMSRENQAIITVRYYVGEDRERSLVKLQKKISENLALLIRFQQVSLEHLAEFREGVEGNVVALAAKRATPSDLRQLRLLLEEARHYKENGISHLDAFIRVDELLHQALARITQNPMYTSILQTLHENIHPYFENFLPREPHVIEENFSDLCEIVQAVENGDAQKARRLAQLHVRRFNQYMIQKKQHQKSGGALW